MNVQEYLKTSQNSKKRVALQLFAVAIIIGFTAWAVHFFYRAYQTVDGHLENHRWSLPATVYAASPVLYPGHNVTRDWLIDYLETLEYMKTPGPHVKSAQYSASDGAVTFWSRRMFPDQQLDFPVTVTFNKGGVEHIFSADTQRQFSSYSLEPVPITNLFGDEWERRQLISIDEVPAHMKEAVLAIEDRRFYRHFGVDPLAVVRAVWNNVFRRTSLQGASTITQQLAKNLYLTPERSLSRKASEAVMALMLERKLSKDQILELYLNEIYLGQRGRMSIKGIGAASRLFFRKEVRDLTLAEAALLAGMIRAPAVYNPYRNPAAANTRRNTVLTTMKEAEFISEEQYNNATQASVTVYPFSTRVNLAPYFGNLVKEQLLQKYKKEDLYNRNLHVFSTIDLEMQEAAEQALAKGLKNIDRVRFRKLRKQVQGCLIAIEPQTGFIRAFVGGRSYSRSQFDRITKAVRQSGSAFKPIVYATALEMAFEGVRHYTPATLISDEPAEFRYHNAVWTPQNYDGRFYGIVPMRVALAESLNVSTAKLAQHVGLRRVVSMAEKFGLKNVKPYPSLALGAFEVSPWQLIEAYTVFANEGVRTELRTIQRVADVRGKTVQNPRMEKKRVIHPETAYVMTDLLKSVMTEGTAAASRRYGFVKPAAGKTGTTDDFRDAWFIGYTPDLICLVWTGYDDNSPLRMNGSQAALPIWTNFMKAATKHTRVRDFERPPRIVTRVIDPATGKMAGSSCFHATTELFIEGTEPNEICTDYDHFSPRVVDFSTDSDKVRQLISDPSYDKPIVETVRGYFTNQEVSDEPMTEVDEEELRQLEPKQFIYFAPDPDDVRTYKQPQTNRKDAD